MWTSQIRLDDDQIEAIRQIAKGKRQSVNRTIKDLLSAQLTFIARCQSGEFRPGRQSQGYHAQQSEFSEPCLDTTYSQV